MLQGYVGVLLDLFIFESCLDPFKKSRESYPSAWICLFDASKKGKTIIWVFPKIMVPPNHQF